MTRYVTRNASSSMATRMAILQTLLALARMAQ